MCNSPGGFRMFPFPRRLRAAVLLCLAALTGCAACREHPVFCAAATAIVAGSAVALADAHSGRQRRPPCMVTVPTTAVLVRPCAP